MLHLLYILRINFPGAASIYPQSYLDLWGLARETGGLYTFFETRGQLPKGSAKNIRDNGASFIGQGKDEKIIPSDENITALVILAFEITHTVPNDDAFGLNVVSVPQALICLPQSFVYKKNAEWKDKMDWVFAALVEGGFDQVFYYRSEN